MGLHKAVALCMDHCYNSEVVGDDSWYKTIVLSGGSSCLPGLPGIFPMDSGAICFLDVHQYSVLNQTWIDGGLCCLFRILFILWRLMDTCNATERLEKELHQLLPPYISEGIRVVPPPFGIDTAWFGAKMISNVRTWNLEFCFCSLNSLLMLFSLLRMFG